MRSTAAQGFAYPSGELTRKMRRRTSRALQSARENLTRAVPLRRATVVGSRRSSRNGLSPGLLDRGTRERATEVHKALLAHRSLRVSLAAGEVVPVTLLGITESAGDRFSRGVDGGAARGAVRVRHLVSFAAATARVVERDAHDRVGVGQVPPAALARVGATGLDASNPSVARGADVPVDGRT